MRHDELETIPPAVYAGLDSGSAFIRNVQKLTIEELIELYAYAEAIVETVREPLVVMDGDLKIHSVNKGFLTTFNVTEKESVGKYIFDLGNGQWNIPALRSLLLQVLPKKKNLEDFEVTHDFPHIGKRVMMLNARTIVLAQYRTKLILLAIEDFTEKRLIEERTEKFISMASHELKTPITSIMVFMQLLEKKLRKWMDKPTSHIMSRVIQQLNVLNTMITDLFDIRKIKEGMLAVKKKHIRLKPVIDEAMTLFRIVNPDFTFVQEGEITSKVYADKERLIQVMTNILSNAVKYSKHNKTIKVKLIERNNLATVSIQDYGEGIQKSDQKHIFEAYVSPEADNTVKGLGLGLFISAEILKLHDGKIWLDSQIHKGSTFHFSLPIVQDK